MKYLFLIIFLVVAACSFGQENRTVRQRDLKDSLDANSRGWQTLPQVKDIVSDTADVMRASIATKLAITALTDSLNPVRSSIATKITSAQAGTLINDSLTANVRGYQTLPQVKDIVRDSVAGKLNSDFSKFPAVPLADLPNDANRIPMQIEGAGPDVYQINVGDLPASSATQALVSDKVSELSTQVSFDYASATSVDALTRNDTKQDSILRIVMTILDSLGISVNPFPNPPTGLMAVGGLGKVDLSWTASLSSHDSSAVFLTTNNIVPIAYVDSGITTFSYTGVGYGETYSFYIKAIKNNQYSSASNIATATTTSQSTTTFIPDLAGLLRGASVGDFSYSFVEGSNTVSVDTGWYKIHFDSTQNYHENAFLRKTFTPQTDSVFVGTVIKLNLPLHVWNAGEENAVLGISDTINGLLGAEILLDDGNADRSVDRWEFRSYNNGSTTTNQIPGYFSGGIKTLQIELKIGNGDGYAKYYVNDTLVYTQSGLVNNAVSPNAVFIGNDGNFNSGDELVNDNLWFNEIYADSRSIQTGQWWLNNSGTPSTETEGTHGWFVDNSAPAGGDYKSWASAGNTFAGLPWTSILPGDTVFISGGVTSKTYTEQFNPAKSGTVGNYIVIRKGLSAGHNGEVIIDGQGVRGYCLYNNSYQYLKFEYLTLKNASVANYRLRTSNNIVSHCNLLIGSGATCGFDIRGSYNIIEYNNSETTSGIGDGQRDFCQTTASGHNTFRYNTHINYNTDPDNHTDWIQCYGAVDGINVYGNFAMDAEEKRSNSSLLYLESIGGTVNIYDNVIIDQSDSTVNGFIYVNEYTSTYDLDTVRIYNNSIYSQGYGIGIRVTATYNADNQCYVDIRNNAIRMDGLGAYPSSNPILMILNVPQTPIIDYNIAKVNWGSVPYVYNGTSITSFATWQGMGFDLHGLSENPSFTSIAQGSEDLKSTAGGNLINAGATLGAPYNVDILGVSRPQGAAYDCGSYEYVAP